jgi:hypothetical protein
VAPPTASGMMCSISIGIPIIPSVRRSFASLRSSRTDVVLLVPHVGAEEVVFVSSCSSTLIEFP